MAFPHPALVGAAVPACVERDAPLRTLHTMGLEGTAWGLAEPSDVAELAEVLHYARGEGVEPVMLGAGSNIVFRSERANLLLVRLGKAFGEVTVDASRRTVTTGAAAHWRTVIKAGHAVSLGGLEYGWCIPGTMGGALAGNAGAAKRDVCDDVETVDVLGEDGRVCTLGHGDFSHRYRKSSLMGQVVVAATLRLEPVSKDELPARLEGMRAMRKSQPVGVASSGCVFKNPTGPLGAGAIIDRCGLKGMRLGGMEVSPVHGNFFVNTGGATPEDFHALVAEVQRLVLEIAGVALEVEVRVIG